MIYMFAALYAEAKPFIQHFQLKKDKNNRKFQGFCNPEKEIYLVITGVGSVAAAVAIGSVCTEYEIQEEDFLINVGTCAARDHRGEVYLCNKITEQSSGRTFYPDLLYKHNLAESNIVTVGKPVTAGLQEQSVDDTLTLYDMEAAAVYQAGAYFFGPHQMSFLKVVSDHGDEQPVTREQMEMLMEESALPMILYVEQLYKIALEERSQKRVLSKSMEQLISKVCEDLHCSKTMEAYLWQHFRYLMLTGVDVQAQIREWYEEEKLPCRDRREGKKCFEELKAGLF